MKRLLLLPSFSVKSLFVIVTFGAIAAYLIRDQHHSARTSAAIARLSSAGCIVLLGSQSPPGTAPESADLHVVYVSMAPRVLRFQDILSPEWSHYFPGGVLLPGGQRSGAPAVDLSVLSALQTLRVLDFGERKLSDDDLAYVEDLPLLKVLIARDASDVTDQGFRHLSQLKDLRVLELPSAAITDEGFKALGNLKHLERLGLNGSAITGRGLEHLGRLPRLRWLDLGRTRVGDSTISGLRHVTSLERLILSHTRITDAALLNLQPLQKLMKLDVSQTDVTFEALDRLRKGYSGSLLTVQ